MRNKKLIKKGQDGLLFNSNPTSFNFSKQFGSWSQDLPNLGFNSQIFGNLGSNLIDPSLSVTSNTGIKNKTMNVSPLKPNTISNLPSAIKIPSSSDISLGMNNLLKSKNSGKFNSVGNSLGTSQKLNNFLGSNLGSLTSQLGSTLLETLPSKDNEINSTDTTLGNLKDSVNKTLMSGIAGPWGMIAGATNSLIGKLGGSSDASSGLGIGNDALNAVSSFVPGLGFLSSKIKGVEKSQELKESSGYSGLQNNIDKANKNAGKIIFGRGKAKRNIADAQSKADLATELLQTSNQNLTASSNSADMFRLKNQLGMSNNSYLYNGVLAAKKGARIKRIIKNQKGNKFETFRKTLPEPLQDTIYYRLQTLWDLGGKPSNFDSAKKLGLFENINGEYHAPSVIRDQKSDEYIFLKVPSHPSVNKELDWYDSADASEFREKYELDKSGEVWKYINKSKKNKEKFAIGGKMNVIPEGALHAHKHNLEDIQDITKKGIPVVSEEEGGILQHAEIEREEIIFTKEVTEKLEELKKLGTDEAAIQAGILLTSEIIENTDDRANLIKSIEV